MNCSNIKPILTTVFSLFFAYSVYAQTGTIQGKVSDALTRESIIGGSVKLPEINRGISTQADGSYVIRDVPPGVYSMEISYVGYKTLLVEEVRVEAGRAVAIHAELHPAGDELSEVVITARVNKEGAVALLTERRKSTLILQKIGAQELNRKGIGNVGEGLTKMVGVSMVGSKDLFVRGLGDRYNNATLNGLPIPSTNPDVKLIPLDIFPTSVVQNIAVVKSYNPSFYGDFSGGTVDIVTKDYPEHAFFKASVSFGGNNMATGQQFLQNDRSFAEKIGFIRSSRRLPAMVAHAEQYDSHIVGNDADPGFRTPWSPGTSNAPVNGGISLSGGNGYRLENGQQLGFLVNVAYKNEYSFEEGISALYNAQKTPGYLYDTESFMYKTNLSGLVSSTYKPNSLSDYTVTGLFVNHSSDVAFVNTGFYSDIDDPIMGRRNTALQNTLYSGQLSSRLQVADEKTLRWALGYTKTIGTMPDRTQNLFRSNGNGSYSFVVNSDSDNHKFFSELEDQEVAGKIEFTFENELVPSLQHLLVGVNGKYKDRAFDARQFDARLKALGSTVHIDQVDQVLDPDLLGDALSQGTWRYAELFYGPNHYRANLAIVAPFVDFSFLWHEKWSLTAGVRVEASRQNTHYKTAAQGINDPYQLLTLDGIDVLPAATLKYLVNSSSNVLLSLSRTISRPLFVESAPFRYNNAAATAEREGNPHLVNGSNYNFDLKYEIYPSNAEIIAFSVFGKYLQNPIELMQKVSASPIFTFVNTKEAVVAGAEVEINRNAAALFASESAFLKNLSLGANASYLYTRIKMDDAQIRQLLSVGIPIAPTNRERPLFGASPYLVNADLSYRANWNSRSHTLFTSTYHVFGKRLFVAGSQNAGDIYELPVNALDFSINSVINQKIGFDISVGNALDQKARFHQEYTDANLEFSNVRRGVTFGASLSYSF